MKPNTETTMRREGNLGEGRRAMSIDLNSLSVIMERLTDLYTDQAGACIREYPVNADDSHRAAGITRPIEVTLPTFADPTFVVKDFGTGLSVNDVYDNLSMYGYSSKRETNNEAGMMGLGFKAALTYTDQFTLIAIKDGVEATVHVDRGEDGVGGVEIVDTVSTNEPNGVTVRIPVHDVDSFRVKAQNFFRYWRDGNVLVDGEPPQPLEGDWIDPDILLDRPAYGSSGTDTIVMGNIPYPVPSEVSLTPGMRAARATVFVPVGSVDPTTSREGLLHDTSKRTRQTLETARDFIRDAARRRAQEEIESASSPVEAIRLAHKWSVYLHGSDYRYHHTGQRITTFYYRGRPVPTSLTTPAGWEYYLPDSASRMDRHTRYPDQLVDEVIVFGHPTKTVSRRQRNLLRGLIDAKEEAGHSVHSVLLLPDLDFAKGWLEGSDKVWSWDEVEAATPKPPDGGVAASPKPANHYEILTKDTNWSPLRRETAPNTARTIYVSRADLSTKSDRRATLFFFAQSLKYNVVVMHPRSYKKFHREHPRTISMPEAITKEYKALLRRTTLTEQEAITLGRRSTYNAATLLNADQLLDPEMTELVRVLHRAPELQHIHDRLVRASGLYGVGLPAMGAKKAKPSMREILDRYPLLELLGRSCSSRDMEDYINGQYLLARSKEAHA